MSQVDLDAILKKCICSKCVGEDYLSKEILHKGNPSVCSYCGRAEEMTWSIGNLADKVDVAFQEHFVRTPSEPSDMDSYLLNAPDSTSEWTREGEPTADAIMGAAEIPGEAAADVQEILKDRHYDIDAALIGGESDFESCAYYERINPGATAWDQEWRSFEHTLKFEARFFSRIGAKHLAAIFNGIDALKTYDGNPVVVEAGPSREIHQLFRARVFQSDDKLEEALCLPDIHLGPPPASRATAGRMNAQGVSVFYGATIAKTAVVEVRPPVGSKVAVARFSIIRPLRLLDLTILHKAWDDGSVFDPTLKDRLERAAFLRTLGQRIARPILPDDEAFEYLPTQAIADFLATENTPQLDGVIFDSPQSEHGINVVLFHKASRVVKYTPPMGAKIEASSYTNTEEGPEIDYRVVEWLQPTTPHDKGKASVAPLPVGLSRLGEDDPRQETLSIDHEFIEVHHVTSINYKCDQHKVSRYRYEKRKLKF